MINSTLPNAIQIKIFIYLTEVPPFGTQLSHASFLQNLALKIKEEKSEDDEGGNKELKRLQFYGAGPKMAGYDDKKETKPRTKTIKYDFDPVSTCNHYINIE